MSSSRGSPRWRPSASPLSDGAQDFGAATAIAKSRRYARETLEVRYKGLNTAEVLDLSVEQARERFAAHPKSTHILDLLAAVGLGYIRLGQPATTLSGGEASGRIVAQGTPEDVAAVPASLTGHYLAPLLGVSSAKAS